MKYENIVKGVFLSRPNRFIAEVLIDGIKQTVHVKNTGRCKELLIKGNEVWLQKSHNPLRKTAYDLIAVKKGDLLINMDSQIPNAVAAEWLKKGNLFSKEAVIKREVTFGNSRFDLFIDDGNRKAFIEVKGVTLENDGIASFPDAPTLRGVKHINELVKCTECGFEAYIIFIIQMKGVHLFTPNYKTHREFGEALKSAQEKGVRIIALDCIVTENSIEADNFINLKI
ncbi:MAG: DNA/RNA nuclease SfsA [Clostridia bacterium]|nr:DNA/RNA nuclease SfsA [Clostridia bacterium]